MTEVVSDILKSFLIFCPYGQRYPVEFLHPTATEKCFYEWLPELFILYTHTWKKKIILFHAVPLTVGGNMQSVAVHQQRS